jgi:hypothetical protein
MKKSTFALISFLTFSPLNVYAAILNLFPSDAKIEDVNLSPKAVASPMGQPTLQLDLVHAGKRVKSIFILKLDVYVIQLFVDQKEKFVPTPADANFEKDTRSLTSLSTMGAVGMQLNFLRDIAPVHITDSFVDAFTANGISVEKDPILSKVLSTIKSGPSIKKGESISILGLNGTTQDKVYIENSRGASEAIEGDSKLVDRMLSLWFGTPVDGGMKNLKETLTK